MIKQTIDLENGFKLNIEIEEGLTTVTALDAGDETIESVSIETVAQGQAQSQEPQAQAQPQAQTQAQPQAQPTNNVQSFDEFQRSQAQAQNVQVQAQPQMQAESRKDRTLRIKKLYESKRNERREEIRKRINESLKKRSERLEKMNF